jgi:hypothetical protein
LENARRSIDEHVAERLKTERAQIVSAEARKARQATADELKAKDGELAETKLALAQNNAKLAVAQRMQAELLRKERALDDAKREMDLTVEKRVQDELTAVHSKARQDAEQALSLKLADKDKQLSDMSRTIEELRRKVEQGSQQAQGEVLELAFEELIRAKFPLDVIEPVPKGEFGGDVIQHVNGAMGGAAGLILWEFKRTKNWSDSWLPKLRDDQRKAKAHVALIVSHALPPHIENFDWMDGVWVVHQRCAIPVAVALRQSILEIAAARNSQQGQQTKMEQIYSYLTGPNFRQRIEAIVEKFNDMRDDLDRERKFFQKQWAKRDTQLLSVLESTAGLYGDLQGIAGNALPELGELELPRLEPPARSAAE